MGDASCSFFQREASVSLMLSTRRIATRSFGRSSAVVTAVVVLGLVGSGLAAAAPADIPGDPSTSTARTAPNPKPDEPVTAGSKAEGAQRLLAGKARSTSGASPELGAIQRALAAQTGSTAVLIARTDSSSHVAAVASGAKRAKLAVRTRLTQLNAVSVEVPKTEVKAAIATLTAQPGVTSVTIAQPRELVGTPDDADYAKQSTYLTQVNAPNAWDVQHGSADVRIAVVDSGVDLTHPDLIGKVVDEYNAVDGSSDVTDTVGHGTFVAGVAAAATGNAVGVAGAGYDSSVLVVKVADGDGLIFDDAVASGITWAADHGADVINLSLGAYESSSLEQAAINYAVGKEVLVVAAAGNDATTTMMYPAAYPNVIAVGATSGSAKADFSNYGSWVDVAAPGVDIYSTTPTAGSEFFGSASYDVGDGTSFSSPLVAGEAALIAAQQPGISVADLRTAVTASAHGFAGQGLGTGRVDFRAAFDHIRPAGTPTITAPASAAVTGAVRITATSTASRVRFQVDGAWLGASVAVVGGSASATWSSWGARNGSHTVKAVSCSPAGSECVTAAAARTFTVANTAPIVRAPASGGTVGGAFTISAGAAGGGLAFYIDGVKRGFDGSAPYALAYSASSLADGTHRVKVVSCSSSGTLCTGPASAEVRFTSRSLHPSIRSAAPNPLSPNKDGRNDSLSVVYRLPEAQSVTLRITAATGATVRGPLSFGSVAAGNHTWVWAGTNNAGHRVADGRYTLTISTRKVVGRVTLVGSVSRAIVVDTAAPTMTSVVGSGTTFYPIRDGYADSFSPSVVLKERVTLTLTIRNSRGVVRTVSAAKNPGRQSLAWNGSAASGAAVPAGAYTFTYSVRDSAGNVRTTGKYRVTVSLKKLAAKSATVTMRGSQAYSAGASDPGCAFASTAYSDYATGLWLYNECYSPSEVAAGLYRFTVPAAARYRTLRIDVLGYSFYGPSRVRGHVFDANETNPALSGGVLISTSREGWYNLGTFSAAGRVSATHRVSGGLVVTTESGWASDFDVAQIKLTVGYDILQ